MIPKQELRIGNKVNVIDRRTEIHLPIEEVQFEIVELKLFSVDIIRVGADISKETPITISYADLHPIPITEERLIEMGWIKDDKINYRFHYDKLDLTFDIDDKRLRHFYNWINQKSTSIHHLQNLIFALTNKEI